MIRELVTPFKNNLFPTLDRVRFSVLFLSCVLFSAARYAMSYDWSQGVGHANPQATNNIFVHTVLDDEIKPRPKDKK